MSNEPSHSGATRNALAYETSPYLLQHARNPVDWHPWGPEALALAKETNRPILLSIGYAACHWCHVMAHESFENEEIAALMNALFINIKVDREERPDIDQIYMAALHALGQQGGWPLTMFLTPDGEPFWGGTYFPPESRWGRPGFPEVLQSISTTFSQAPDRIIASRDALKRRMATPRENNQSLTPGLLDAASEQLASLMDTELGGIRGAPKFPQPSLLDLLWRHSVRSGNETSRDLVLLSLTQMCEGGIYDHLGGGFSRYSVDDRWLVPHFEKMLYDNAQLIDLLSKAYAVTRAPLFATRIEETIGWLTREMLLPEGAFASSLDADSEGEEGRFYVWTKAEIEAILGERAAAFSAHYDVTEGGNWEGHTILNRSKLTAQTDAIRAHFAEERAMLLQARAKRVRPDRDDKILADWNALTISALARASIILRRPEWLQLALDAYRFISTTMMRHDRSGHSYRAGKLVFPGFANDHAAMIRTALILHELTGEHVFLDDAERWTGTLNRHYWDNEGAAYFVSADDAEALILRMKANADEAIPSANGTMAECLTRLWILTGEDRYRQRATDLLQALSRSIATNLFASCSLLAGFDTLLEPVHAVIIVEANQTHHDLLEAVLDLADPRIIVSILKGSANLPESHPAFGKQTISGQPTLYICRGQSCSRPVTDRIHVKQAMVGL